jgi:hypothetical protein
VINRWITRDEPLVSWFADLSPLQNEPERLWSWLRAVLEAGEQQQVYVVRETPKANYSFKRDGPFVSFLERRFRQSGDIDLFHFAYSGMQRIGGTRFSTVARMAYYEADGQLTEAEVDDLGALLRRLRPEGLDLAPAFVKHSEPIVIGGPIVNADHPTRSVFIRRYNPIRIDFALLSDIWFPWVPGLLEDSYNIDSMYDNHALSLLHTPRLNRFLSYVREQTLAVGGAWGLDKELSDPELDFMLLREGINLGAPLPNEVNVHKEANP